jgi:hypothetical protein
MARIGELSGEIRDDDGPLRRALQRTEQALEEFSSQLREAPAVPADCRTPMIGIEVPADGIMRSYQL